MGKQKEQKTEMDSVLKNNNGFYALVPRQLIMGNTFNGKKMLSMGARTLLVLLLSFRNLLQIRISQGTMGKYLSRTRQTICKWVKELKDAGLITCEKTGSTCIINFTPLVKNSIQACKDYNTQESNKRNKVEKVYKESFSKNKSLTTKNNRRQYDEFNF